MSFESRVVTCEQKAASHEPRAASIISKLTPEGSQKVARVSQRGSAIMAARGPRSLGRIWRRTKRA